MTGIIGFLLCVVALSMSARFGRFAAIPNRRVPRRETRARIDH